MALGAVYYLRQETPIRHTHHSGGDRNTVHGGVHQIIKLELLSVNPEVDPQTIDRFLAKGWLILLWTLNDEEGPWWALGKRPYGAISDEPHLAKRLRDSATTLGPIRWMRSSC